MKRYIVTIREEHSVEVQTRDGWDDINIIDSVHSEVMTLDQLSEFLIANTHGADEHLKCMKDLHIKNELDHSHRALSNSVYYTTIVVRFFDEI